MREKIILIEIDLKERNGGGNRVKSKTRGENGSDSIVDTTTLMSRKTAHPFPTPPALYDCLRN